MAHNHSGDVQASQETNLSNGSTKSIIFAAAVLTGISLFFGLVLFLVNMLTSPVIESARQKKIAAQCEGIFSTGIKVDDAKYSSNTTSIVDQIIEIKKGDVVIGVAFIGTATNQYGSISLLVGLEPNGNIKGINAIDIVQTKDIEVTRTSLGNYKDKNITSYSVSNTAGVTYSHNAVESILTDVKTIYNKIKGGFVVADPIKDIFGEGYALSEDLTPVDNKVTEGIDVNGTTIKVTIESVKEVTGTSVGYILKGKAERTGGKGPDDDANYNPTVEAEIGVDATGKVLFVTTWSVGDSGGNGITKIVVGASINSYAAQGGSTITTNVYQALINKFSNILNSVILEGGE
jgi:hypothetical protein